MKRLRARLIVPLCLLGTVPAKAQIVLDVVDPTTTGVIAAVQHPEPHIPSFAPASQNPTFAEDQFGSRTASASLNYGAAAERDFNFNLDLQTIDNGTGYDCTGKAGSPLPDYIVFRIVGQDGESAGTPVTLTLNSSLSVLGPLVPDAGQSIDDVPEPVGTPVTLTGFTVGDTFRYSALLDSEFGLGDDHIIAQFMSSLSVRLRQVGDPLITPEPGPIAFLGAAAFAGAACASLRLQRRFWKGRRV
jgi:hypothetical protein